MTRKFSQVTTAPVGEPITTAEAKSYLRVDTSDDDTLIDIFIAGAHVTVQEMCTCQIYTATRTLYLDDWSGCIQLDHGPVNAVNSVKYYDSDNSQQTLATTVYELDDKKLIPEIVLQYGQTWPTIYPRINCIEIEYGCGYSTIPDAIKMAVMMIVKDAYDHRGSYIINEPFQTSIGIKDVVARYLRGQFA